MTKKKQEESFYVSVREPLHLRRQMLETSKGLIKVLQGYEALGATREKKAEAAEALRSIMKDVHSELAHLRTMLPVFKPSELPEKKPLFKQSAKKKGTAPAPQKEEQPERPVSKLQQELADIERRLKDLQ